MYTDIFKSTCGLIGLHATTKENMKKIMKEGIKPGMKGGCHANIKVSYVLGFRSALDKFNEILDYLSTYASGETIEQYFDLYMIGVNIIQNIIESGEHLPEIKNVIKDIDLLS